MPITRHPLPSGGWADLREPSEVRERYQRPVRILQMRLMKDPAFTGVIGQAKKDGITSVEDVGEDQAIEMATQMGGDAMDLMDQLSDRIIIGRVAGWSYGEEVTLDALLDLTSADYNELKELTAKGALTGTPDFSPSTEEASPTGPSTGSV